MPPTGVFLYCRGAGIPSVVHAVQGPSLLTVTLVVGHGAGVSGCLGQDALMLQELEDGSWMVGCRSDA